METPKFRVRKQDNKRICRNWWLEQRTKQDLSGKDRFYQGGKVDLNTKAFLLSSNARKHWSPRLMRELQLSPIGVGSGWSRKIITDVLYYTARQPISLRRVYDSHCNDSWDTTVQICHLPYVIGHPHLSSWKKEEKNLFESSCQTLLWW